jgi:quinolinate synthase
MKRITLENIYDALVEGKHEIRIPEHVRVRAKRAIDRMLALPKTGAPLDFKTGLGEVAVEVM